LNPSFVRNYIPASPSGYPLNLPAAAAELFNSKRTMEVPDIKIMEDAMMTTVTEDGFTYHCLYDFKRLCCSLRR
jgi:hypothetical protein